MIPRETLPASSPSTDNRSSETLNPVSDDLFSSYYLAQLYNNNSKTAIIKRFRRPYNAFI
ncbi:hypothetical protein HMPREF1051_1039 [Neisseria sicca VK64]|uniref:Uncharacterized protein n=1 Tax=Neisseria sicca VK64 TaxID=1095748 RepID=I2NV52_NEISI|nr:hypothetical protein HMPREF1051_1039 [Neisseria sicca VK64]